MKNKITFLLLLVATIASGQTVVTSNATLSILPNTIFFSSGDVTNNGAFLNNGTLILTGAWTNAGTYQAEGGVVTLNGSGQQIINHNAQSFSKLVISGGGEKLFQADLSVKEQLVLQQGILKTDNNSKIILDETATISGGSDDSYVEGAVYTTGTGSKLYPVGINGHYLPLSMESLTGSSPVVGVQAIEPNPTSAVSADLVEVSHFRYWSLTTLSGTFGGGLVTIPTIDENFNADKTVVAQADESELVFHSAGAAALPSSSSGLTLVSSKNPVTMSRVAIGVESTGISVYNVVTPGNNDGKHDFLKIVNIEFYPNNEVTIVNRWGDKVFQIQGYNNTDHVFSGEGNAGGTKDLSDGTYYYVIDKKNGEKTINGFFILRR